MTNILITGANRGLGLEFVKQYSQKENTRVFACCRNPQKAEDLNKLASDIVSVHALDVLNHEQIDKLAQELKEQKIDVLINNSGVYGSKNSNFDNIDYEDWVKTLQVNTMSPLKVSQAFISHIESSSKKTIVIITSQMGSIDDNTSGGNYIYRSSKSAVNMVGKSMSHDLKSKGIITLLVHPGWVATDMGGPNATLQPPQSVEGMRKVIENATSESSGKFYNYDGREIAW